MREKQVVSVSAPRRVHPRAPQKIIGALATLTIAAGCTGAFHSSCESLRNCGVFVDGRDAQTGSGGHGDQTGTGGAASGGKTSGAGGASGATSSGGATTDGGSDADVDATPPCNGGADPSVASCVVTEQYGVFVAPGLADSGTADGSRLNPYGTLTEGLAAAKAAGKRVYACANGGTFKENVAIGAALDGLQVYGGFDCTTWAYQAGVTTNVLAASPALHVTGLVTGLLMEDFSFESKDGTLAATSSVAALVTNSASVVMRRVTLKAGKGANGADGVAPSGDATAGTDGKPGTNACVNADSNPGGAQVTSSCDATSIGGSGGPGGVDSNSAGNGNQGQPKQSTGNSGASGFGENGNGWTCSGGPGLGGANAGAPGTSQPVASGAASPGGTLSADGFKSLPGDTGKDGTAGQGGGGGGGAEAPSGGCPSGGSGKTPNTGASGGSGGSGGCGGKGGPGGVSGGASIALATVNAPVTLAACTLIAQSGGAGGNGAAGQNGASGGAAGKAASGGSANDSCDGGRGGKGGDGGNGGGGAGGPSIGIASVGTAPSQTNVTITVAASPASGGADGSGQTTGTGAGAKGLAVATYP